MRVVFKFKKKKKNSPNLHKLEDNKGKDSGILWPFVVKWRRRASVLLKQGCFRTLLVVQNFSYWTQVTSIF